MSVFAMYDKLPYTIIKVEGGTSSMMPATKRATQKNERLEARVSSEVKALFQEAATLEGRTLTDFIVQSVTEAAKRTLRERDVIELSQRDRVAFVNALLNPPKPSARLQSAAQHYKQMFGQ